MSLNQKTNQQAKDVIFSHILNRAAHPPLGFTSVNFTQSENQKYLGIILISNLKFKEPLKWVRKIIGLLGKHFIKVP